MKKEINPAVGWVALVIVAIAVAVVGFKLFVPPAPEMDKKVGDATMERVKAGGKMYEPPPGAVGPPSGGGSSAPGYNLKPPGQ